MEIRLCILDDAEVLGRLLYTYGGGAIALF